ncbi:hypothetical protein ACLOJK_040774 [Asimina triloba]
MPRASQLTRHWPQGSERNVSKLTLDGVDVMGERLAEEPLTKDISQVVEVIGRKQGINKISFIAHSVGGLVARYAIGRLYKPRKENLENESGVVQNEDTRGTIAGLEAMNFITVATPHLGSRGHKQHLFLNDTDKGDTPLLKRMVEDCGDLYYMSALRAFRHRVVYSNVGYDRILSLVLLLFYMQYCWLSSCLKKHFCIPRLSFNSDIVGWRTSSIRRNFELPKWEDSVSEKYPHIVYEEQMKGRDDKMGESVTDGDDKSDVLEEVLVAGLSRVSWEKVDVSFHTCKQKFAAHSIIQRNARNVLSSSRIAYCCIGNIECDLDGLLKAATFAWQLNNTQLEIAAEMHSDAVQSCLLVGLRES